MLPYTVLEEGVEDAVRSNGLPYQLHDVSGSDDAYWLLLRHLWRIGATFAIVEQDIVVGPRTLREMARCRHPWCCAPYQYLGGMFMGLGCAKFDAVLMSEVPTLLEDVGQQFDSHHQKRHFCIADHWISTLLKRAGYAQHAHRSVEHLSPWPSHTPCDPRGRTEQ